MDNLNKQDCLNPRPVKPSCGCGFKPKMNNSGMMPKMNNATMMPNNNSIEDMALAMCYVPWQHWCKVYDLEKGLACGTIFPELYKPFLGSRCC